MSAPVKPTRIMAELELASIKLAAQYCQSLREAIVEGIVTQPLSHHELLERLDAIHINVSIVQTFLTRCPRDVP